MPDPAPKVVLHQFAFSHYNEKVRWALDWKGIAAERVNLLPGFHFRRARKLTGQTQTPFLSWGDETLAGSAAIVERIDAEVPDPPLFPADPEARRETQRLIAWLDDEVGPATRLALFHALFADPEVAKPLFASEQPRWKAAAYGALVPRMIPMLRREMSIDAPNAARAEERIDEALDRVVGATAATGYLVGDAFTAADLSAACLLFPLSFPPELPFVVPNRDAPVLRDWLAKWEDHPGVRWMERIFRDHRNRAA